MECEALIYFSKKSICLEERRILNIVDILNFDRTEISLLTFLVSVHCSLLFLILLPLMKTLFVENL